MTMQKPTIEEVGAYCATRKNGIDPEQFWAYYEARGWKLKNGPMVSWMAAVITWERHERKRNQPPPQQQQKDYAVSPERALWALLELPGPPPA